MKGEECGVSSEKKEIGVSREEQPVKDDEWRVWEIEEWDVSSAYCLVRNIKWEVTTELWLMNIE